MEWDDQESLGARNLRIAVIGSDGAQAQPDKDVPPMGQRPDQQGAEGQRSRHPDRRSLVGGKTQEKCQSLDEKKSNREKQDPSQMSPEFPNQLGRLVGQLFSPRITGCHPITFPKNRLCCVQFLMQQGRRTSPPSRDLLRHHNHHPLALQTKISFSVSFPTPHKIAPGCSFRMPPLA